LRTRCSISGIKDGEECGGKMHDDNEKCYLYFSTNTVKVVGLKMMNKQREITRIREIRN
jgi:hypothetical protein